MSITSKEVRYQCGEQEHIGYFARPEEGEVPQPGVLVIHEWWGINDYIKYRVDMLAREGFCAFAIDMYGDGLLANNPDQAGKAMNKVLDDMQQGTLCLNAGYQTLLEQNNVDAKNTAAIGYCFGGAMALHMARIGMPLSAVASFHGALGAFHNPTKGSIQAKILICHGGADAMVSMDDVESIRSEMDKAEADYEVIVHEGAAHGFTSKEANINGKKYGIPVGYDERADHESWSAMMRVFDSSFS
jgi:dienelactone hydrolase